MQGEVYDVLPCPAGSREDRPLQSPRWQRLPAPPPQYRAGSTSHPPAGGAAEHFPRVSQPPAPNLQLHRSAETSFAKYV